MTLADFLDQIAEAERRFWFITRISEMDETERAIKVRFEMLGNFVIQAFLSEATGRINFALIHSQQRLFGYDYEHGQWHRHPYAAAEQHVPVLEGLAPHPLIQFLAEVETILVENDLI